MMGLPDLLKSWYVRSAERQDRRLGGTSMEEVRPSRFRAQGAEATQSSDYRALKQLFRGIRLTKDDLLVDVGCGEGRVLTWLYLRRCPARLVGAELDPDVAAEAAARTADCDRIEIRCGNILEQEDLLREATVFYLFNPFNGKIFSKFTAAVEKHAAHPVTLIYLFDYYGDYLKDRPGWTLLREVEVRRPGQDSAHGSIYRFDPEDKS